MSYPWTTKVFHIKKHDELLAVIHTCHPADEMFWLACAFNPAPLFSEIEPLFHQIDFLAEQDDNDAIDRIYDQMIQMGVRLFDVDTGVEIKYFSLFFQEDGTITLRYAEPPYLNE